MTSFKLKKGKGKGKKGVRICRRSDAMLISISK